MRQGRPNGRDLIGGTAGERIVPGPPPTHGDDCVSLSAWGFEDSNMVNFDWYYPKYAWRQTEEEIKNWCKEFHLKIEYFKERQSGYACLIEKN